MLQPLTADHFDEVIMAFKADVDQRFGELTEAQLDFHQRARLHC